MKKYVVAMWAMLFLEVFTFCVAVETDTAVWAQVFCGGVVLFIAWFTMRMTLEVFCGRRKVRCRTVHAPRFDVGDVIYDLQDIQSPFPGVEVRDVQVRTKRLVVEDESVYYIVNGLRFDLSEFDVTWTLSAERAREIANGIDEQ